ncbi:MAG: multicopper oxidase domain-containing protein [Terrimonas sp.]|nr:multicopper oxidase domain-containing protein [Terrimonas sp.]
MGILLLQLFFNPSGNISIFISNQLPDCIMDKNFFFQLALTLFLFTAVGYKKQGITIPELQRSYLSCGPGILADGAAFKRIKHPRLVYPGDVSALPKVLPNDNRTPAGKIKNQVLELELEVLWGDFFPETNDRPGLRLVAIAEKGKAPSIPGPLIRVEEGQSIHASIHNTLKDSSITVFGFQTRPATVTDSLWIPPGATRDVIFKAGEPGTYLYWIQLGKGIDPDDGEEEQLGAAFIIDPRGGSPADRVLVMNIFSTPIDTALFANGYLESLTINGRSWPFTERMRPQVGDTVRWRVINSSNRNHPMHLHGFYYDVLSLGNMLTDHPFPAGMRPAVVTETMRGQTTMNMQWVAKRPGKWLFHCHLSFHVSSELRLPGARDFDQPGHEEHMAGLVTGIEIQQGSSDLLSKGNARKIDLYANQYAPGKGGKYGFSFLDGQIPTENQFSAPGPLLILKQYQPTFIDVFNHLTVPTSVHWHGLEIESWSDGVPGWSSSDGRTSPAIQPGEDFTYRLSPMRPGSFIYHSHLDDVHQLTSGLYGPMIVIGEHETYDPKTDHFYISSWKNTDPLTIDELEMNGGRYLPETHIRKGESHRLRLMNIGPAGMMYIRILKDGAPVPFTFIAKDGADLPPAQQEIMLKSPSYGVGETADFRFTPQLPGTYTLEIITNVVKDHWVQTWVVRS